MASFGVGSALTGVGAHLEIIDDPHKEGDEQSQVLLDGVTQWYTTAARTRLHPGGRIVIPHTRWSEDDLIGQLIHMPDSDPFEYFTLPALALENDMLGRAVGEALWPERYPREELLKVRALSSVAFDALYQQNPQAVVRRDFDISRIHLLDEEILRGLELVY